MPESRRNLARLAEDAVERRGDYEALVFEGGSLRSSELWERTARVASGLEQVGLRPGERAVVLLPNSPDVQVVYGALWRAGAVVTPAIFLLPPDELRRILLDAEASLVVTSPEFLSSAKAAAADVPGVRTIVSTGSAEEGVVPLAELASAAPGTIVARADSDLAALLYTGGTTGRSKGVMLTHANLWFAGKAGYEAGHVPGVTRGLMALPLSHAYGLLVTVTGLHSVERPVTVLMRWFDAPSFLELVQEHRVETSALVPSMLQALLSLPLEEHDLSSLRSLVCGAAPLSREVLDELGRRLPHVELREGYGLTETSGLVSSNRPGRVKPGSVGLPVPGAEVRIVDDAGRELPAGDVGEILCRSGFVMAGYWRSPELTAETVRAGWLRTGDLGYLDEEGFLYVVDRRKDLIVRDGFNVFPGDVEDALLEHAAVAAAGVVGRPDDRHGEEVVAVVALRAGAEASADELVSFAKTRLGAHRYPREVRLVRSLPLTPVGKVDRKLLRAEL